MERGSFCGGGPGHGREASCSDASSVSVDSFSSRLAFEAGDTAAACTGFSSAVTEWTSSRAQHTAEARSISLLHSEESRCGGAAATGERTKKNGDGQVKKVNKPGVLQYAPQCATTSNSSAFVDVACHSRGSDSLCFLDTELTEGASAVLPLGPGGNASDSGDRVADHSAAQIERQEEVFCGSLQQVSCVSPAAKRKIPYLRTDDTSKGTASALDSKSPAASTEQVVGISGTCQLSPGQFVSQKLEMESAVGRQLPPKQSQQYPRGSSEDGEGGTGTVTGKKDVLVDGHDAQYQLDTRYQRRLDEFEQRKSYKLGTTDCLPAGEIMGKNDQSFTPQSRSFICTTRKASTPDQRNAAYVRIAGSEEGRQIQSYRAETKAHDTGDFCPRISPLHAQQYRRDSAEDAPTCCSIEDGHVLQRNIKNINADNSSRFRQLRQFTLELLYAVSLLRPLGGRGDRADCISPPDTLKGASQERVESFTGFQVPYLQCTREDCEKGYADAPVAANIELKVPSKAETIWCSQHDPRVPTRATRFRRSRSCGSLDDVAALERRVTEALSLCTRAKTCNRLSAAAARDAKRHWAGGEDVGSEESRADIVAADVALAVASAAGGSPHNSFEALAEEIGAAKTIDKLAVYLCGCFAPLLHLLQEHMEENRLQVLGKSTMNTGNKGAGGCNDDLSNSQVGRQTLPRGLYIGRQADRRLSRGTHVDETVEGVNAILQVLMEVDRSAADSVLDSVCKLLFSSCHEQIKSDSLALHPYTAVMKAISDCVGQMEDRRPLDQAHQPQQDELTCARCPSLSEALVPGRLVTYSRLPIGAGSPSSWGEGCERISGRLSRSREVGKESIQDKGFETGSIFSPSFAAEDVRDIEAGEHQNDVHKGIARVHVGDQQQVSNDGITISSASNVQITAGEVARLAEREGHFSSLVSSSTAFTRGPARSQHGFESTDAAESLLEACRASDTEEDVSHVRQYPLSEQPHEQKISKKAEEHVSTHGRSTEYDDPLSRRTAWLAAQLSTPLDHLKGDSPQEACENKSGNDSKEVMYILETLERAVLQPPLASHTSSSATAANAKELLAENSDEPRAWESGVQLVLRMLREQEEQLSASEAAVAYIEDLGLSARERNPKRRAVFEEDRAKQAARQNVLTNKIQLRASVCGEAKDQADTREHTERPTALRRIAPAEVGSPAGRGMVAGGHSYPSRTDEESRAVRAGDAATFKRIAAAVAVERAATAVAQQGAIAAVEHARLGSAGLMEKMRDLAGPHLAKQPGPISASGIELAASSCRALRRAVEYVEPFKNEEADFSEESRDMLAELDDEGLDNLVCQLLKIAERPIEHQRQQQNKEERSTRLQCDVPGSAQEPLIQGTEHGLTVTCAPQPKHTLQHEAFPPYVRHQAQWKKTVAEGHIVRRGSTGGATDVSRHSFIQRETNARGKNTALRESYAFRDPAHPVGEPHVEAVSSYMRTTQDGYREKKLLASRVSPAFLNPLEVSTTITNWPLRESNDAFGSRRLSLNAPASTGNTYPSPVNSPFSGCRVYVDETQSDARSFGTSRRQSSVKRSPWRSCEPYGSSASTMVASPGAPSTKSLSSSSLTSSPFSLLTASAIAVLPPSEMTPDLRLQSAADANALLQVSNEKLVGEETVGKVEALSGDKSTFSKDPDLLPHSSTDSESRQRRYSAEEVNLPFRLLPSSIFAADRSSNLSRNSINASPKNPRDQKAISGKSVIGPEGGQHRDRAADSFHAQLRALDFFDIAASARAHLLAEAASPSAPVMRGIYFRSPTGSATKKTDVLTGRRQEQGVPTIEHANVQRSAKSTQGKLSKCLDVKASSIPASSRAEGSQGSIKAAAPIKVEHSHPSSSSFISSAVVRSSVKSGSSTAPAAVRHVCELNKSNLPEATRFALDTPSSSGGKRSRVERADQGFENAEIWGCRSPMAREARSTTAIKERRDQEQQLSDTVARVPFSQSWTQASAGCTGTVGRQQHQQAHSGGKDFRLRGNGPADSGDPRRRRYAEGERQEEKPSTRRCESLLSSPVFTRSMPAGAQKEPAVAGCVGIGGADCTCGGALCLYRSAVSGVVYDKSGQKWTARWNEDGRQHKRTFAAAKYGFLSAKLRAEACRGEARERTARTKHEALQRQQESFAHRFGLFAPARHAGTSGHSHAYVETDGGAAAASRSVNEPKQLQS